MTNALIRKLQGFAPLSAQDCEMLVSLTDGAKEVAGDQDLIREGDNPGVVHVILEGLAVRYKLTEEGKRQIFAYLIPGDFCDLHVALLKRIDHSIRTLSTCRVARIKASSVVEIIEHRPALTRALLWSSLVDHAVTREWLVNVGQRQAEQRIAHLFSELHTRMMAVDLTTEGGFELPVTQAELGDTMGLSPVHVNRSLKELREKGLVTMRNEQIAIPDIERLKAYSGFDPSYLHLRQAKHAS